MPETFGSGTAGLGYDPRILPFPRVSHHVASGGVWTWATSENNLWIVTAVDIVSDGGGGSGFVDMSDAITGFGICIFNIGTSGDAFSWRGWYSIPDGTGGALTFTGVSGQGFSVAINGLVTSHISF